MSSLLTFSDDKVGDISGGTDLIILPQKSARAGYGKSISVLFEMKTAENTKEGLNNFESQCFVELLAARCISDQRYVLLVLTDLVSKSMLFEIEYSVEYKRFIVVQDAVTLDQVGTNVASFLSEKAVSDAKFYPVEEKNNPRDSSCIVFKKTKLSHDIGLTLEHFNEMAEDTEPNSRERACLVADLFRSMDVPHIPLLVQYSMYT